MAGVRVDGVPPEQQDAPGAENLGTGRPGRGGDRWHRAGRAGQRAEAVPLRTAADAIKVIDWAGEDNLGFLCDLFYLHSNGDDLTKVVDTYADRVAHVQIADAPGRGEPGTGEIDLDHHLGRL